MNAREKLLKNFGSHMTESMTGPTTAADRQPIQIHRDTRLHGTSRLKGGLTIPLDLIDPDPDQPRKEFEPGSLARLAASLKERGQLTPCRVRRDEGRGRWVLLVGERRFRAAQLAGLPDLQAVEETAPHTPEERLDIQLVENCLREDLKPVEQARAFQSLMERLGLSQRQLAERLHLGAGTVSRALALLELPETTQVAVDAGEIPAGTAYEIGKAAPEERERLTALAKGKRLTRTAARRQMRKEQFTTPFGLVVITENRGVLDIQQALTAALTLFEQEKNRT